MSNACHVRLFWFVQPGEYKFLFGLLAWRNSYAIVSAFQLNISPLHSRKKVYHLWTVDRLCFLFTCCCVCINVLIFTAMQSYRWFVRSSISEEKRKHVLHRKSAWAFHTGANNSWNLLLLSKTMASCQRISGLPAIYHYACLNQVSYGTPSRSFDLWWAMSFISCWIFGIWFFLCLAKYHWFHSCWDGFWDAYHFPFGHVCQKLFLV